jgi:hypothetical protein
MHVGANAVAVATMLAGCVTTGCSRPARKGALIDAYSAAACVSPIMAPDVRPPSRQWDNTLQLRDGRRIKVLGLRAPGGAIQLKYPTGALVMAANAGDYIYPADVRWDAEHEFLYVKAHGWSAAPWEGERAALFEYDVRRQRQLKRQSVDVTILPPECVAGREAQQ